MDKMSRPEPKSRFARFIARDLVHPWPSFPPMNSHYAAPPPDFFNNIDGARANFAFYFVTRTGMFGEPPHRHRNDEYLMFFSSDPHDMKDLGATIEIGFGEEWEKYTFSTSMLVKFPRGVMHCPIHVRKLERPFFLGHFWPMGEKSHIIPAE